MNSRVSYSRWQLLIFPSFWICFPSIKICIWNRNENVWRKHQPRVFIFHYFVRSHFLVASNAWNAMRCFIYTSSRRKPSAVEFNNAQSLPSLLFMLLFLLIILFITKDMMKYSAITSRKFLRTISSPSTYSRFTTMSWDEIRTHISWIHVISQLFSPCECE